MVVLTTVVSPTGIAAAKQSAGHSLKTIGAAALTALAGIIVPIFILAW